MVGMPHPSRAQTPPYRIVGYFTGWAIYGRQYFVTDVPAEHLTHINYAFANISARGEVVLGDEWGDTQVTYPGESEGGGNFHQLRLLKAAHPHLQTLISVGGWTWSGRFSDAALTPESRARFAQSAVDFMVQHGFDGVDLDWEYPTGGGDPGNTVRPEDPENFILLLEAVRTALDARGTQDGRTYLLTIAAGAGERAYAPLDWARIHPLLDWINVMTYDYAGSWSDVTGFNAPLYDSSDTPPENGSADRSLQAFLARGVPADKIVLGAAFYGRGWSGVGADNNGLHQPYTGLPTGTWEDGVFDYDDVIMNHLPNATRYWDARAGVPYIYNSDTGVMISYDDPESLTLKADYVREHGLGGVMFWELSSDDADHTLLRTLSTALNGE